MENEQYTVEDGEELELRFKKRDGLYAFHHKYGATCHTDLDALCGDLPKVLRLMLSLNRGK